MIFEGEDDVRDFATVYRKEYGLKRIKKILRTKTFAPEEKVDYNVISEAYKNRIRTQSENENLPYSKRSESAEEYMRKIAEEYPRLHGFLSRAPPDEAVIEREMQKLIKSVYQEEYCTGKDEEQEVDRIILPENYPISETIQSKSYRDPKLLGANNSLKQRVKKPDDNLGFNKKEREILQTKTGKSEYQDHFDKVGELIMKEEFYGSPMPKDLSDEQIEEMIKQKSACSEMLMDTSEDNIISQIF
ncbi:hypothetical protein QAD02_014493 [Eretmocerus hayati]|uniref:Uncharacterized protein n=1 Tax=Eretmocerus hayati TaxID=131215 RepID=A0ACC2P6Q2_9HYME|nr:hypothetical protein QAD02_014493 [Eretmocerus hayati]